jgi:hypothetical protein
MPRTPRNPGSGKPPYNGPARGVGIGGDAKGAGWGGDAQGEGRPLAGIDDATSNAIRALARDPKAQDAKAVFRERVLTTIADIMVNGDSDSARVTAALGLAKKIGLQDEPAETRVTGAEGGPVQVAVRKFFEPLSE